MALSSMFSLRKLVRGGRQPRDESSYEETAEMLSKAQISPLPPPPPLLSPLARKITDEIVEKCECWVYDQWATPASPIVGIHINPAIVHGSPVLDKFEAAVIKEGINIGDSEAYLFGWHGTDESNVPLICHGGFDVELRKGQQYGPGEYFGWTNGTSMGYCRDGSLLLVCLIIKGRWTSQQPGTAIIVRNPQTSDGITYCLPILVVNFGHKRDVMFMSGSSSYVYGQHC